MLIPLGVLFFVKETLNPTRALKLEAEARRCIRHFNNLVLVRLSECFLWDWHRVLDYGPLLPKVPS
jgi:hypothetical protein